MIDPVDTSESTLRYVVWKALEDLPDATLLEYAQDDDVILSTLAAKTLHFRASANVFASAVELCAASKAHAREIGCFILGQLGTPEMPFALDSFDVLVRAAEDDPDEDVRATAIAAMGHLKHGRFLLHLIAAASDPSPVIRSSAAFALAGFQSSEAAAALARLADDPDEDTREWALLGLELLDDGVQSEHDGSAALEPDSSSRE